MSLLLWLLIAGAVGAGVVTLTYRIGFRAGLVAEDERRRIEESEALGIAFERQGRLILVGAGVNGGESPRQAWS